MTSDLMIPAELSLKQAGDALARTIDTRNGHVRVTARTFYDTFDGALHAAGLVLIHHEGALVLAGRDSLATRARLPLPARPTDPFFAAGLDTGPLREQLVTLTELRVLLPRAHVRSRVRTFDVLDARQQLALRLTLEDYALVGGSPADGGRALATRLRLIPMRGDDEAVAGVRDTLERELGFAPAPMSLAEEAVLATGGRPDGVRSKVEVELRTRHRSDNAVAAVLRALLEVIEANLDGAIADLDSEFLHDLRVAVRRSRAVQRELRGVFDPQQLAHFRGEFRWLQQVTGDARDFDVHELEFDAMREQLPAALRPDLEPLLDVLRAHRVAVRQQMVRALRSGRARELFAEWAAALDGLEASPGAGRPDAGRPIAKLAGERIRKRYGRMVKMGSAIDSDSGPEAYHELRKQGKELRYLLELFGTPLFPQDTVRPMVKALKSLQDVLGRHQDREVQIASIDMLRYDVARVAGGARALRAIDVLVKKLREDELETEREFQKRFEAFASQKQQRRVEDTFT